MGEELRQGAIIGGRFRLDGLLGRGGMGQVWAATNDVTGRRVALKFLHSGAASPELRRRFAREARAASRVDHPNVITVHDAFELADGNQVMVMDLLRGETLRQLLERERTIGVEQVADIFLPVVSAVGAAHALGIVHRDLKPENVFLVADASPAECVQVLDFGIAKLMGRGDAAITQAGQVLGTPAYMALEQCIGEVDADHRIDVWAVGVMLYEALSGVRPVTAESVGAMAAKLLQQPVGSLRDVAKQVPGVVVELVDRMLARDKEERLEDLRDAARVLAKFASLGYLSFGEASTVPADDPSASVTAAELAPTVTVGPDTSANNLPVQATSFIGRRRELARAREALGGARLLTLIGPGGTGKTRLALRLASELTQGYPDGVWLVELAHVAESKRVEATIARTLQLRDRPNRAPGDALIDHLRDKSLLLLLDNCEHVVEQVGRVAASLLASCPRLRIVSTSRIRLDVPVEQTFAVDALALPESGGAPDIGALLELDAVALFAARGATARSGFAVTADNVEVIAAICRRLDGLPLAIELAAARLRALSLDQLHDRLRDRFGLLTGGPRSLDPRQRSLRAAVDWSYQLLPEHERILLHRLGVFEGSFTLEAVEAVCAEAPLGPTAVLDLLTSLVDSSLVKRVEPPDGSIRFLLLETIRQYALDCGDDRDELDRCRQLHASHYGALVGERLGEVIEDPALRATPAADMHNLEAAMAWSLQEGDCDAALTIAAGLCPYWYARGQFDGALRWLTPLLDRAERAPSRPLALALIYGAYFGYQRGDLEAPDRWGREALRLARLSGDERLIAVVAYLRSRECQIRFDEIPEAEVLAQEAIDRFERLGDAAHTLPMWHLANIYWMTSRPQQALELLDAMQAHGQQAALPLAVHMARSMHASIAVHWEIPSDAVEWLEEARVYFAAVGLPHFEAFTQLSLAMQELDRGDLDCAAELAAAATEAERAYGHWPLLVFVLSLAAHVALERRDVAAAEELARQASELCASLRNWPMLSLPVDCLGALAMEHGESERAVTIFGLGSSLHEHYIAHLSMGTKRKTAARIERLRQQLGAQVFDARWAEGRALDPAKLTELFSWTQTADSDGGAARQPSPPEPRS